MSQYIHIGKIGALIPGQRCLIDIAEHDEALVLNIDGKFYAINNVCPHAGAALERGTVVGNVLFCPLHQWGFCLTTGQSINHDDLWAQTYRVVHAGDSLYLALESRDLG